MPDAVIVDAVRTPIGRAAKGSLKDVRADDLAAVPLRALVDRNPEVDFAQTVDILMGCGFPMGEQGYNVGRNAQLLAGIDHHVPAVTVSRFCSSSLQALRMAFHAIAAGEGDQYVAAGVEAVSRFPAQPPFDPHPELDGSDGAPYNVYIPMGLTAENVAKRCGVSREAQDEWAATSSSAPWPPWRAGTSRRRSCRSRSPTARRSPRTTARARARRSRCSPSSSRRSTPRARSRRATRARSTTARPPCWSCRPTARPSWAWRRARGSSRPRSPRSGPRSWASGRSPRWRRCSPRPG